MSATAVVSHRTEVTEDQIDHLGHMNVRYYMNAAMHATRTMYEQLGLAAATPVVQMYTRHHREQMLGASLEVRSGLAPSSPSVRLYHELLNVETGDVAATFLHDVDHRALEAPAVTIPAMGFPRSIDLDVDVAARAPTAAQALELGLVNRLPRVVTDQDTVGAAVVPPERATSLIWDGEHPDGPQDWVRTGPAGERIGVANMESRVVIRRLPELGTTIQSFGAAVDVGEKVTRRMNWAIDLDRDELLVASESIGLCFNIGDRRSMVMPPAMRADYERSLHPQFG